MPTNRLNRDKSWAKNDRLAISPNSKYGYFLSQGAGWPLIWKISNEDGGGIVVRLVGIMLFFALTGCVVGNGAGSALFGQNTPPPTRQEQFFVCKAGLEDGNPLQLLDKTYDMNLSDIWQDYQISASYSNGLYYCNYQFIRDFISFDSDTTYFHHAVETVSIDTNSMNADATVAITSPLRTVSDTIVNQMPTNVYNQKQQEAEQKVNDMIQNQINYIKDHPCVLWQTNNNVTTCIRRQGEL